MLRRDANMLHALLKKTSPSVHRHLEKHNVEPFLYVNMQQKNKSTLVLIYLIKFLFCFQMTDWFLCAMTRTLPWDTLLRIWDCFLCEGIKVVFKVKKKFFKLILKQLLHCDNYQNPNEF